MAEPSMLSVVKRIVGDIAPQSKTLKRVGVVGSLARDDFNERSDVDLVFETDEIGEALSTAGRRIESILMNQFRRKLDIIDYGVILKRKDAPSEDYLSEGYEKMFGDLIWIWGGRD